MSWTSCENVKRHEKTPWNMKTWWTCDECVQPIFQNRLSAWYLVLQYDHCLDSWLSEKSSRFCTRCFGRDIRIQTLLRTHWLQKCGMNIRCTHCTLVSTWWIRKSEASTMRDFVMDLASPRFPAAQHAPALQGTWEEIEAGKHTKVLKTRWILSWFQEKVHVKCVNCLLACFNEIPAVGLSSLRSK